MKEELSLPAWVAPAVCWLCITQSAFAGSIIGWGSQIVDTTDPGKILAVAAGWRHSLAIKKEPCQHLLAGDLNDDCRVDFADLAIMAAHWLIDCDVSPADPACIPK